MGIISPMKKLPFKPPIRPLPLCPESLGEAMETIQQMQEAISLMRDRIRLLESTHEEGAHLRTLERIVDQNNFPKMAKKT